MQHEQVARFLARIPETPLSRDADAPDTVFPSPLELDRQEEEALVAHAVQRIRELQAELGRDQSYADDWYSEATADAQAISKNFMASRQLAEMTYHGRMGWRGHVIGGIFAEHNLTIPLARRIVQQQHSRANDYFFSTDPWFAVSPVGDMDEEKADKVNRYARWTFDRSRVKDSLMKAVELAFMRGEQVLKPARVHKVSRYETWATVAIGPDGEALVANDGDYIYQEDEWVGTLGAAGGAVPGGVVLEDELGLPVPVLGRDPSTVHPGGELRFEHRKVWREITVDKGVEVGLVYYKDFLCPLAAESVQDADCVVHLYDQPAFEIVHNYMAGLEGENGVAGEDFASVIDLLRSWEVEDGRPKAERNKPRAALGESGSLSDLGQQPGDPASGDPVVEVAEVYLRYDANGDGHAEDIMLLLDLKNERPIYYDYLPNVTPDGRRPFHVVRVNPVDGRWHGIGQVETFWNLQEFADLLQNRWSQAQSGSGWIDIIQPDAVEETDANGNIEINGGDAYHLKPNRHASDFLTRVPLYDNRSGGVRDELQWLMQLAMNMSGVANTNDGAIAGLESTKLATGIRNIEKAGQELFGPYLSHLEPGIIGAVRSALTILLADMEEAEVFEFFEGDTRVIGEIRPEEVADLELDIQLELTRYKGEQELKQAMSAEETANRFYDLSPERQERLAPLYRQQLKLFQVKNADRLIEPIKPQSPPAQPPGSTAGLPLLPGMESGPDSL